MRLHKKNFLLLVCVVVVCVVGLSPLTAQAYSNRQLGYEVQPAPIPTATEIPLHVFRIKIQADQDANLYTITIDATGDEEVARWEVLIVDAGGGNQVDDYLFNAIPSRTWEFTPEKLELATKYTLSVSALNASGQPLQNAKGDFILGEEAFTHWEEIVLLPELQIAPINIDRQTGVFRGQLQVTNEALIASFAGQLINADTGELITLFAPMFDQEKNFELSLEGLEAATYKIVVFAVDENDAEMAQATYEIEYTPKTITIWYRLFYGLRERPYIPILIVLIIAVIIIYILWTVNKNKKATGLTWAEGENVNSSRSSIHSPLNQTAYNMQQLDVKKPRATIRGEPIHEITYSPAVILQIISTPGSLHKKRRITIENTPFKMGRMNCDLNLGADKRISREHAQIEEYKGEYYLRDLNSKNGSYVNGQEVGPKQKKPLGKKAKIRLGQKTILQFERH